MAERSFPFDGGQGATITEADWSMLTQTWQDSGVSADGPWTDDLKVTSLAEAGKIYVSAGEAHIRGFHYVNDDTLQLTINPNTHPSYERIDLVVVRLDKMANEIRAVVKEGTPAASPVAPALDQSFDSHEVPLAQIRMPAGATSVTNGPPYLVDRREFIGRRIRISDTDGMEFPRGTIFYNPTTDKFYSRKTSGVEEVGAPQAPPGLPVTYRRTADSAAITVGGAFHDPQLSPPLTAGTTYRISGIIFYKSSASDGDLSILNYLPSGSTGYYSVQCAILTGVDTISAYYATGIISSVTGWYGVWSEYANTVYSFQLVGVFTAGKSGIWDMTFTPHNGNHTILAGSHVRLEVL